MKYIRVEWLHSNYDYPTVLYSELDEEQWEIRKVEVYSDGRYGYANETNTHRDTQLSVEPLPAFDDIVADPQFRLKEISREEFEAIWSKATNRW